MTKRACLWVVASVLAGCGSVSPLTIAAQGAGQGDETKGLSMTEIAERLDLADKPSQALGQPLTLVAKGDAAIAGPAGVMTSKDVPVLQDLRLLISPSGELHLLAAGKTPHRARVHTEGSDVMFGAELADRRRISGVLYLDQRPIVGVLIVKEPDGSIVTARQTFAPEGDAVTFAETALAKHGGGLDGMKGWKVDELAVEFAPVSDGEGEPRMRAKEVKIELKRRAKATGKD